MVRFKEIGSQSPLGSDSYTIEQFLVHCKSNTFSTCRINDLMARTDKLTIAQSLFRVHYKVIFTIEKLLLWKHLTAVRFSVATVRLSANIAQVQTDYFNIKCIGGIFCLLWNKTSLTWGPHIARCGSFVSKQTDIRFSMFANHS